MRTHCLKTWVKYYNQIIDGTKCFEIRQNDRDFKVGDRLVLQEWNNNKKCYSGRETDRVVSYIIQGEFGLPENICVMQLKQALESEVK